MTDLLSDLLSDNSSNTKGTKKSGGFLGALQKSRSIVSDNKITNTVSNDNNKNSFEEVSYIKLFYSRMIERKQSK
jgi:hypothetical protein